VVIDPGELREVSASMSVLLAPLDEDAAPLTVVAWLDNILAAVADSVAASDVGLLKSKVDLANIDYYRAAVRQLLDVAEEYGISMQWYTFLTLTDRMVSAETVNFEGKPLKGLQVMGLLETRALDFERIVIPSLNE
ncbi:MAG: hypothetical protein K2H49_05485, partial [Muribaculaceae bacterium]|nr:hypothetical protein [Muribaculaceae bacterium]